MLYPLSYGGSAAARTGPRANGTEQPYQPAPAPRTTQPPPPRRPATTSLTSQTSRNRDNRQDTPGNCAHERPNSG
jgi:hypothetical protein